MFAALSLVEGRHGLPEAVDSPPVVALGLVGDAKELVRQRLQDDLVRSKNSCGLAHVVFQGPPEPCTTRHGTWTFWVLADRRKEEHVAFALMIPLVMKMRDILRQRMAERRFPKEDEPRETLLLNRAHPALRVGVQIRSPRGRPCACG